MRHKKLLAVLVCLFIGLAGAFACPSCAGPIPVPASVTRDNVRMYHDSRADVTFWFSAPNRVSVYNSIWSERSDLRKSGTYRFAYEYGTPFIHFYWDAHTSPRTIRERFLILRNEHFMFLYNDNTNPAFRARHGFLEPVPVHSVRASSTLTLGHLHFAATPDRLGAHINRVWAAEGGVGERLYIERVANWPLVMSIGYVHYSRPYLFKANARPKRIRIASAHNEARFFEVELEDTPHYQTIHLSERGLPNSIIIEILEIRPGFRYNHMCVNSVMWLSDNDAP